MPLTDTTVTKTKLKTRSSTIVRRNTGVDEVARPQQRDSVKSARPQTKARAIYPCTADQDDELSFEKGQVFVSVKQFPDNDGWYQATMELNGKQTCGLVPGPFIEFFD